jgi:hypothetical protein
VKILCLDFSKDSDTSQQYQEVDSLALVLNDHKERLSLPLPPFKYVNPPNNDVTLYYQGRPLVSKIVPALRRALYSTALCQTICKQETWTDGQFDAVDWPALELAFLRTLSCKHITYSKLSNKLLSTNVQNKKFYNKSDKCPSCSVSEETIIHMLTCPAPDVAQFRIQQQKILWNNLLLIDTPDSLLDVIKIGITQCGKSQPSLPASIDPVLLEAYHHQTSLGWEAFLCGRVSLKWQLAFLGDAQLSPSSTSLKWAGQLVGFLLHLYAATMDVPMQHCAWSYY